MTTTVHVAGMVTEHCKRAVFTSLAALSGIVHADVQLGRVVVAHDGSVTEVALRQAIAVAGYDIIDITENRRTLPLLTVEER